MFDYAYIRGNLDQGILAMPYNLILSIFLDHISCFFQLTLYHYTLKRVQLFLDSHLNNINSELLGPYFTLYKGLQITLLLDAENDLV